MSRAIQRLMKDYRKAEKLVGDSCNEPFADFANIASLTSQTYAQQMAQLRRDPELTQDEKKYLVAVERKCSLSFFFASSDLLKSSLDAIILIDLIRFAPALIPIGVENLLFFPLDTRFFIEEIISFFLAFVHLIESTEMLEHNRTIAKDSRRATH